MVKNGIPESDNQQIPIIYHDGMKKILKKLGVAE